MPDVPYSEMEGGPEKLLREALREAEVNYADLQAKLQAATEGHDQLRMQVAEQGGRVSAIRYLLNQLTSSEG